MKTRVTSHNEPIGNGIAKYFYEVQYLCKQERYSKEIGVYYEDLWVSYQVFGEEQDAILVANLIEKGSIMPFNRGE